jgi:NAD(P)H dehydrogenase (quinone)
MTEILVLYYSRSGATEALAREIADGVDSVTGCSARLRTVPPVSAASEATAADIPDSGPPYATLADLRECSGLLLGSASKFGNMAAPLKYFLDQTVTEWFGGALAGKPAGVFASSGSLHGGQETTLLSMMIPLLHHGMLIVGIPYLEEDLSKTTTGGTPYGATHVTWNRENDELSAEEARLARVQGKRVADYAVRLQA